VEKAEEKHTAEFTALKTQRMHIRWIRNASNAPAYRSLEALFIYKHIEKRPLRQ
jgi:hypothetical protein